MTDGTGRYADADERLRGLLSQVQADYAIRPEEDVAVLLQQRLTDSGIEVDDEQFDELLIAARRAEPEEELEPGAHLEEPE
jgi:hypothetical protein